MIKFKIVVNYLIVGKKRIGNKNKNNDEKAFKRIIFILSLIIKNKNKNYSKIGLINLVSTFFSTVSVSLKFSFLLINIDKFSPLKVVDSELRSITN